MGIYVQGGFFFSEEREVAPATTQPPMDIAYEKSEALTLLNEIREAIGMNTLIQEESLDRAAQAHADYLIANHVATHDEIPGLPKFTGVTPAERAIRAGYLSRQVSENLSAHNSDAQSSIDGLFSAIYHRFGFLDTWIDEIGVGVTQNPQGKKENAFVYVMGNSQINALCQERPFQGYGRYVYSICKEKEHKIAEKRFLKARDANKWLNPKLILYPYDGQTDVPPAFYDESPDPLPDYDVSGFPISVIFNDYFFKHVTLSSFTLSSQGKTLHHVRLLTKENDPNKRLTDHQFALMPLERLRYNTQYTAKIRYQVDGKSGEVVWHFHTKKPLYRMVRITQEETTVTMKRGETILLYLVPQNGHDMQKQVIFPDNVHVTFLDNHTLRVSLLNNDCRSFDIKSDHYKIHVRIESSL